MNSDLFFNEIALRLRSIVLFYIARLMRRAYNELYYFSSCPFARYVIQTLVSLLRTPDRQASSQPSNLQAPL